MNRHDTRWCNVAVLVASVTAAGCSVFHDDTESQWRTLTVIHVQSRAELGAYVDTRCVGPASVASSDAVVVVKYRVGRARRFQAFPIPGGRSLHEGDTVVVHPSQCLLKDATSPA